MVLGYWRTALYKTSQLAVFGSVNLYGILFTTFPPFDKDHDYLLTGVAIYIVAFGKKI